MVGLSMKRLTTLIAKDKSGQVWVKYLKIPTILLYSVGFTNSPPSSLVSCVLCSIGHLVGLQSAILVLARTFFA